MKKTATYSIREVAVLCHVHEQTVRHWIGKGLKRLDDTRPTLIYGRDLFDYLTTKIKRRKRPCSPGQMYCCSCREGRFPKGSVQITILNAIKTELIGKCEKCGTEMRQFGSVKNLQRVLIQFELVTTGKTDLSQSSLPGVNTHFETGATND